MADRQVTLERVEGGLVEDLRDQTHVLVDQDLAAVADRDAGRLLATVLEGVEAEVGELRDVLARCPDPEDAAGVLRSLVVWVERRRQPSVAAGSRTAAVLKGHPLSLGDRRLIHCFAGTRGVLAIKLRATSAAWARISGMAVDS